MNKPVVAAVRCSFLITYVFQFKIKFLPSVWLRIVEAETLEDSSVVNEVTFVPVEERRSGSGGSAALSHNSMRLPAFCVSQLPQR